MPQDLTLCALDVALGWRDPDAGLVHHSDRGSQYAANAYRKKLKARGITVSMSRKGDCWDNAPMESVNVMLKVEPLANWPRPRSHRAWIGVQNFKADIRQLTRRSAVGSMSQLVEKLKPCMLWWKAYFGMRKSPESGERWTNGCAIASAPSSSSTGGFR